MADDSQYALGVEIGRLTTAVESLSERIGSLESDMRSMQIFFQRGKGAITLAFLVILFAANGVLGAFKALADWAR